MDNKQHSGRVSELLGSLSSLGEGSSRIIERLKGSGLIATASDANHEDVSHLTQLENQLTMMRQRIAELGEELDSANDVVITDNEMAEFRVNFLARIKDTQTSMLYQAYDTDYFAAQPRSLRPVIAEILLNLMDLRKASPLPLWQRISHSGGAL